MGTKAGLGVNRIPMLNIGATRESVLAARGVVMEIFGSPCSDELKVEALKTLRSICEIGPVTVSNNSFTAR